MGVNDSDNDEIVSSTSKMDLQMLQKIFVKFEPDLIIDSYEVSAMRRRYWFLSAGEVRDNDEQSWWYEFLEDAW